MLVTSFSAAALHHKIVVDCDYVLCNWIMAADKYGNGPYYYYDESEFLGFSNSLCFSVPYAGPFNYLIFLLQIHITMGG